MRSQAGLQIGLDDVFDVGEVTALLAIAVDGGGFINELSIIFNKMGIDTKSVLAAAGTKWNFLQFFTGQVGGVVDIDGGGYRHNVEFGLFQASFICGELHGGSLEGLIAYLTGGVDALLIQLDLGRVQVKAHNLYFLQRKPQWASPHSPSQSASAFLHRQQFFIQVYCKFLHCMAFLLLGVSCYL